MEQLTIHQKNSLKLPQLIALKASAGTNLADVISKKFRWRGFAIRDNLYPSY